MKKRLLVFRLCICIALASCLPQAFATETEAAMWQASENPIVGTPFAVADRLSLQDMVRAEQKAWDIINRYADPEYFLTDPCKGDMTKKQQDKLRKAAEKAVSGCSTQYDKIKAIVAFVADRTYYDYAYLDGNSGTVYISPYDVYKYKRTVCEGYKNLVRTLMIDVGIPCMQLLGENHTYNAAYDSDAGRWIFADATWCSKNFYSKDGDRFYNGYAFSYFDLSPEKIAELKNHEVYMVEGLLDEKKSGTYYTLTSDHDRDQDFGDMTWSDCDWHLEISGLKEGSRLTASGFAGFEVTSVQYGALLENSSLKAVDLTDTEITEIDNYVFWKCKNLKTVKFPSSLERLGKCTFYECEKLTAVDLSKTKLTKIEEYTFGGCSSLKTAKLPKTLKKIGNYAFCNCPSLKKAELSKLKLTYVGDCAYYLCHSLEADELPDTLRTIGEFAFAESRGLQSSKFPSALKKLGKCAFYKCTNLQGADLSKTKVTEIGEYTFCGCSSLKTAKLPKTLKKIGRYAFCGCTPLEKLDLSKTKLVEIGEYAFYGCSSLKTAKLPDTLKKTGDFAFEKSTKLVKQ